MTGYGRRGEQPAQRRTLIEGNEEGDSMCRYLLLALLGLALSGCAVFTATSGQVELTDDVKPLHVRFSDVDRAAVQSYYRKSVSRNNRLPGVNLVVGNALPSGIKGEPLPRDLEQKLSPLPSSYLRLRVGPDIVLIERRTRTVQDILRVIGS
jgi:hypothetical protein